MVAGGGGWRRVAAGGGLRLRTLTKDSVKGCQSVPLHHGVVDDALGGPAAATATALESKGPRHGPQAPRMCALIYTNIITSAEACGELPARLLLSSNCSSTDQIN